MTDEPKQSWQHAWDYGIETGRYILVGEQGGNWQDAVLQAGPNFDTAPLHTDPRIAVEQQILDNMVRAHTPTQDVNAPETLSMPWPWRCKICHQASDHLDADGICPECATKGHQ